MLNPVAWGKLERGADGNVAAHLGLIEHSIDVAAVVAAFLDIANIRRRLEVLAGRQLNQVDVDRLSLIAFLHDAGKASSGFQTKYLDHEQRRGLLRSARIRDPEDCGHTRVIGGLLNNPEDTQRLCGVIPLDEIELWGGLNHWLASISHHGKPITWSELSEHRSGSGVWKKLGGYDPWHNLAELGRAAQSLLPGAFDKFASPLPERAEFIHAYAGLVSLSDWIGSDAREHAFPYDLGTGIDRWPLALERAKAVLREMCIDVEHIRADLVRRAPMFGDVFQDERDETPFQANALQACMAESDFGQLVVAESETGSGKTEAALWRFKCLFERGEVDSLAFVLPTRVSAVQIEQRVNRFIDLLFPDKRLRPNVLLALPGYWRVDGVDADKALPGFQVKWPDSEDEPNAYRRWVAENTKRYLAACCAIGSIDQVLLSSLKTGHSHLRGFALLRSLLVVDEVHASDAYMSAILREVLRRHEAAGGHALLLSATLGLATRDAFLGRTDRNAAKGPADYPSVSHRAKARPLPPPKWTKHVHVERRPIIDEPDSIAEIAANAAEQGGRVLVVRNSVHGVIEVQRALEETLGMDHPALFRVGSDDVPCPHHGRFAAADRRLLDQAVEDIFGKSAPDRSCVLIGSQTLEQSLDIDADLLITDLAPIDVLLQRIGRLHRHRSRDGHRPEAFREARVIVLVPGIRDLIKYTQTARHKHGFAPDRAYENLPSVDATWELLETNKRLAIPDQNRDLVEFATDPSLLEDRVKQLGEHWQHYWHSHIGGVLARRQSARLAICDWTEEWEESTFPGSEQKIQTRLGIAAVRLQFDKPLLSPFGKRLKEIATPSWMLPENFDSASIKVEQVNSGLQIIHNKNLLRYDRHGLQ